jgi:hypothetical protein
MPTPDIRRVVTPVVSMSDPQSLQVNDYVRFTAFPEEWGRPGYVLHAECKQFMKTMVRRRFPSRVYEIDEFGTPWIAARLRRRGRIEHHTWGIFEATGWRKVQRKR